MNSKFEFTPENQQRLGEILERYPHRRAAMLPVLHLAHEQNGFISPEVEACVAKLLDVPLVDVHQVLTFYSLYFQRPMGRHHVRLCMSISCWIRQADQLETYLARALEADSGGISPDGVFSWEAVPDCLGACELAPMMQMDKDYYGPLTLEKVDQILKAVRQRGD